MRFLKYSGVACVVALSALSIMPIKSEAFPVLDFIDNYDGLNPRLCQGDISYPACLVEQVRDVVERLTVVAEEMKPSYERTVPRFLADNPGELEVMLAKDPEEVMRLLPLNSLILLLKDVYGSNIAMQQLETATHRLRHLMVACAQRPSIHSACGDAALRSFSRGDLDANLRLAHERYYRFLFWFMEFAQELTDEELDFGGMRLR